MALRMPTPELIDAVHHEVEPEEPRARPGRRRIPLWGRAAAWAAVGLALLAVIWRFGFR